jgi:predicted O-linked N-acetylglucosamine transferase (SPINDLY family)
MNSNELAKNLINPSQSELESLIATGLTSHQQGQALIAKALYEQVIKYAPKNFNALQLLGLLYAQNDQTNLALEYYRQALEIDQSNPDVLYNYGFLLHQFKKYELAIPIYDQVIHLRSDYGDAHLNRGAALKELNHPEAAIESYERAIACNPNNAIAHSNKGNALQQLGKYSEAIDSFNKAIAIKSDYVEAFSNRGAALLEHGQWQDAALSYQLALEINPKAEYVLGALIYLNARICNWYGYDQNITKLTEALDLHEKASPALAVLCLVPSIRSTLQCAQILAQDKYPESTALGKIDKRKKAKKIKIGYFSADFHNHATVSLMAGLFENHDREKFEIIGFSFGPDQQDDMRKRVVKSFDQFHDVSHQGDLEITRLARALGIDIAIDLKGYTQGHRTGIFAYRAAPIQVNYLGYPGTMGAPYIDYLVADRVLIPETSRQYYSEKIVYLPHSYQVNDRQRAISEKVFSRQDCGLPESGFVYCCFNNNYKITPEVFASWMKILRAVPGSLLWLFEDNKLAVNNLISHFKLSGMDPGRLIFAPRMALPEHLARHGLADLFLDTLPCNAHTTASDALWAGLPVLTCLGETFASRVSASLLNAINLSELVTTNLQEYEALAIRLGSDPKRIDGIKRKLAKNRLSAPLFDTHKFTEGFEQGLITMMHRYHQDLEPDHILIS